MGKSPVDTPEVQQGEGDEESRICEGYEAPLSEEAPEEESNPEEFPYQAKAWPRLVARKKIPLLSPPGSGKTRMLLTAWMMVADTSPTLIFVGRNGTAEWVQQFERWVPESVRRDYDLTVLTGVKPNDRTHYLHGLIDNPKRRNTIVLTTWQSAIRDKWAYTHIPWKIVIFDEAQKLFNRNSSVTKFVNSIKAPYFWPATGTEMRKGPQNLFAMLQLCDPKLYRSYWKFVDTWCEIVEGYYGKEIIGAKNSANFQKNILQGSTVHIPEEEVTKYMPEKHVVELHYEMSPSQRRYYDTLEQEVITIIQESNLIRVAALAISRMMNVRQLMCCPKSIDTNFDFGGGIELICERLEEDPHIVIFTAFTKSIPYFVERLHKENPDAYIGVLKGGMGPDEVKEVIAAFDKDPNGIIICSIAFSESFSITTCKTAYVLGNVHTPDVYKQATDRIRRASTIYKHVTIYDLICKQTVDELVVATRKGYTRTIDKALGRLRIKKAIKGTT